MRQVLLAATLLLATVAMAQSDDSDIPVLKRRPAPDNSSSQPTQSSPSPSSSPPEETPQNVPAPAPSPSAPPDAGIPAAAANEVPEAAPASASTARDVILTRSGGVLRVTVADPNDADGAGRINMHLHDAAARYARGEFSAKDSEPQSPAAAAMRQMRSRIIYTAHAIDGGAELIISSQDQKAIEAIHRFLEAQR